MTVVLLPLLAQLTAGAAALPPQPTPPVLDFPEPGMDDPAAYEGYRTRFYRDAADNTIQIYIKGTEGRVVALLADAANESVGFTVRDSTGRPTAPAWGAADAIRASTANARSLEFRLTSDLRRIDLGWFLLGSMRVERDLQYEGRHLRPFDAAPFPRPELDTLIARIARLGDEERQRHLELLDASDVGDLRARLSPTITRSEVDTSWIVTIDQPSFDGRSHLALELRVARLAAHVQVGARSIVIRSRSGAPIDLAVRITTSSAALTPIGREELLNAEFRQFLAAQRAATDSAAALRHRWLERQVRGLELVSSREKLMAGLPNFATYFGRDMLMSALMMEPIWSPGMLEHVIGSVLRKLSPTGEVSHEEALGGQAIRENAAVYNERMTEYRRHRAAGRAARADSALAGAREVLARLGVVRENYSMLDDDFQFPIVVARYLDDGRIPPERKRAFLLERASDDTTTRLTALLRTMEFVRRSAAPYAAQPVATNLVAFPRRPNGRYHPGSWRDSNAGYGNGRFAMDINAIWVPEALGACARIVAPVGCARGCRSGFAERRRVRRGGTRMARRREAFRGPPFAGDGPRQRACAARRTPSRGAGVLGAGYGVHRSGHGGARVSRGLTRRHGTSRFESRTPIRRRPCFSRISRKRASTAIWTSSCANTRSGCSSRGWVRSCPTMRTRPRGFGKRSERICIIPREWCGDAR